MRKTFKFLLIFFVVLIVLFFSVSATVLFNSKALFLSVFEKNLGVKADILSLKVQLPGSLVIEGFRIKDGPQAEKIVVSPSLIGFLSGEIVLNSVVLEKPRLRVTRNPDDTFDWGIPLPKKAVPVPAPEKEAAEKKPQRSGKPVRFYVNRLKIAGAEIEFIDRGLAAQEPFVVRLSEFDLEVMRQSLLQPLRMQFTGKGNLAGQAGQRIGNLAASGWVDYPAKDMDAKVLLSDVQLVYFGPYYKKFLKKDLGSGHMEMTADLKSKSNALKGDCHVELNDVAFQRPPEALFGEPKTSDLTLLAFDAFLGSEGKVVFDFTVNTKMDAPKFENVKVKGSFLQPAVRQILSRPSPETVQDFKKIGEEFKAIGKEFKRIFKSD